VQPTWINVADNILAHQKTEKPKVTTMKYLRMAFNYGGYSRSDTEKIAGEA
jgi:hypothetical protein